MGREDKKSKRGKMRSERLGAPTGKEKVESGKICRRKSFEEVN